jgi:hypothetical protein
MNANDLNRLHDEARQRAHALRDEAIDEFWRGANAVLWDRLSNARRAAERLSQRLQRHRQLRSG